jgi:hypothetical protein
MNDVKVRSCEDLFESSIGNSDQTRATDAVEVDIQSTRKAEIDVTKGAWNCVRSHSPDH